MATARDGHGIAWGSSGLHRKFVHNYGIIAKPLTNLLKKKSFVWTEQATQALLTLKEAMASTPVLRLPNFTKQFVVESRDRRVRFWYWRSVDARATAIAFMSKSLSQAHLALPFTRRNFLP
jgi:hypothetical protein